MTDIRIVDLHTHSNCSDGSMTPEELINHAYNKGVSAIALTDHDTVLGIKRARAEAEKLDFELIEGVEFSTETDTQIHILGLYIDIENQDLLKAFEELQEERKRNNQKYLEVLAAHGFPITEEELKEVAPIGGIGRAHYAKIMMKHGWVSSVNEAFREYLGVGMPCYVKRDVPRPEEAIRLIHNAGGLAFFAHPYQTKYSLSEQYELFKSLKAAGLDGIEAYYSEYTPEMHDDYMRIADELDLLVSGGSDFHAEMKPHIEIGIGKGKLATPYSVLEKIKSRL